MRSDELLTKRLCNIQHSQLQSSSGRVAPCTDWRGRVVELLRTSKSRLQACFPLFRVISLAQCFGFASRLYHIHNTSTIVQDTAEDPPPNPAHTCRNQEFIRGTSSLRRSDAYSRICNCVAPIIVPTHRQLPISISPPIQHLTSNIQHPSNLLVTRHTITH